MQLTPQDIEHIAELARLDLTDAEKQKYAEELTAIFSYMEMLNEVDTNDVPETVQVTGRENAVRDDVVEERSDEVKEKLLQAFPQKMGRLLQVSAVFTDTNE